MVAVLVAAAVLVPATAATTSAAALPDLTITRSAPATAYVSAAYTEHITVTNLGSAATPSVKVTYAPGTPVVGSGGPAVTCGAVIKGHSGRGGGYRRVGWACTKTVSGGLAPGASTTLAIHVSYAHVGLLNESLTVVPWPVIAQLDLVSHAAAGSVNVILPPVPAAPTGVTAVQVGDDFQVGWVADPATAALLTSSHVTATPVGSSAPVLDASVPGTASSAMVGPLQPQTTYQIVVSQTDAAGTGQPSDPITVTTPISSVPPSAPQGLSVRWIAAGAFLASWTAAVPGDSPVDQYQVKAAVHDADPPVPAPQSQTLGGSAVNAVFSVDDTFDWSVQVRAHNAAGWGKWSPAVIIGGL